MNGKRETERLPFPSLAFSSPFLFPFPHLSMHATQAKFYSGVSHEGLATRDLPVIPTRPDRIPVTKIGISIFLL